MIYVTSLANLSNTVHAVQPSRIITLLPEDEPVPTPGMLDPEHHLKLFVHDIATVLPGMVAPGPEHITQLIAFIEAWQEAVTNGHAEPRMVVHCRMGISRSGAAAFIALCMLSEPGQEEVIAADMRRRGAHIQPNILMVEIADELLGREGRMIRAIEGLGAGSGLNMMDWLELNPPVD